MNSYFQFPVEAALKMDRETVDGRPMFVSRCETKAAAVGQKQFKVCCIYDSSKYFRCLSIMYSDIIPDVTFQYATSLERNKLFVKNLPFSMTKEALENLFAAVNVSQIINRFSVSYIQ